MKKIIVLIFLLNSIACFGQEVKFTVNSKTIKERLLTQNISILQSFNNVELSKLNVNMARAKLFPSLNLGVLLPGLSNPTFLLSSINILFPFLVPSNWAVLKQQGILFEADKQAYKTMELNLLSNAYSVYYTIMNDQKIQKIFSDQTLVLQELYTKLKLQSDVLGNVSLEDLNISLTQLNESKTRESKLRELIISELANMRTLLALPLGSELLIEDEEIPEGQYENQTAQDVSSRAESVSTELSQLNLLVKAAKTGKFSKQMGFVGTSSIGGAATSSSSAFGNLKAGTSFSLGLDNIVSVEIAQNAIDSLKLRVLEFKEENEKVSEILIGQLNEIKKQHEFAKVSLDLRLNILKSQRQQFELGLIPLQNLLQTQSQLADNYVNLAKIELDLKLQRSALSRLVVDGEYSQVKGCLGNLGKFKGKTFLGIFHYGAPKKIPLDKMCQN